MFQFQDLENVGRSLPDTVSTSAQGYHECRDSGFLSRVQ